MDKAAKIKLAVAVVVLVGAIVLLLNYLGVFAGGPQTTGVPGEETSQPARTVELKPKG